MLMPGFRRFTSTSWLHRKGQVGERLAHTYVTHVFTFIKNISWGYGKNTLQVDNDVICGSCYLLYNYRRPNIRERLIRLTYIFPSRPASIKLDESTVNIIL